MPPTPKQTIEPSFIQDLNCPICGKDMLRLKSMQRYPDYVTCTNCHAQFVAEEGGERVMYGEIPASYPRTRRFALQQWAWPEAIARRAAEERSELAAETPSRPSPESDAAQPQEPVAPEVPDEALTGEERQPPGIEDRAPAPPDEESRTEAPQEPTASAEAEPTFEEPELPQQPAAKEPTAPPPEPTPPAAPEPAAEEPEAPGPPGFEAEPTEPSITEQPAAEEPAFEPDMGPQPWQPPEETEAEPHEPAISPESQAEEEDWLPPFGEASEEEEAQDLPEDFEPAPEMPDWLSQQESEPAAETEFEPSQAPPEEEREEDEDMAAALWEERGADPLHEDPARAEPEPAEENQFASEFMAELEAQTAEEPQEADLGAQTPEEPAGKEYSQEELAAMYWTGEAHPETETTRQEPSAAPTTEPGLERPESDDAPQESTPHREPIEPEPGVRHRVVLKTSQPNLPTDMCGHCTQTPPVAKLPVRTTLYRGTGVGERQTAVFRVPICADCRDRINAHSDERQTAQLQAHLISVLVALVLVVGALAFRVVDFRNRVFVDLTILAVLALMGYVVPVAILLLRASRYPKPPDARYVASTLRIPSDTEGLETAYEWRSPEYAAHFLQSNRETATGGVTQVKERQYESHEVEQPAQ